MQDLFETQAKPSSKRLRNSSKRPPTCGVLLSTFGAGRCPEPRPTRWPAEVFYWVLSVA